jgi:cation transporter-like permease
MRQKDDPEPEILVPPDMESFEIEDIHTHEYFPYKRLVVMILLSLLLISVAGTGFGVYMQTERLAEVIPYWIFAVLLITPTAFSYYYFCSFFRPKLRNPYD